MYVLFKTDDHHNKQSEELLGVATTKRQLVILAKKVAKDEDAEFRIEDEFSMYEALQTQGYEDGEFIAYEVKVNELLE